MSVGVAPSLRQRLDVLQAAMPVTLLMRLPHDGIDLYAKIEYVNPTGSAKDRRLRTRSASSPSLAVRDLAGADNAVRPGRRHFDHREGIWPLATFGRYRISAGS